MVVPQSVVQFMVGNFCSGKGTDWKNGWPGRDSDVDVGHKIFINPRFGQGLELFDSCWEEQKVGIVGGLPCRTASRLRNIRPGSIHCELPLFSEREQMTDSDSAVLLKQLCLYEYAENHKNQRLVSSLNPRKSGCLCIVLGLG